MAVWVARGADLWALGGPAEEKKNAATGWVTRKAAYGPEVGEELKNGAAGWVVRGKDPQARGGPVVVNSVSNRNWIGGARRGLVGLRWAAAVGRRSGPVEEKKNSAAGWVACGAELWVCGGPAGMSSVLKGTIPAKILVRKLFMTESRVHWVRAGNFEVLLESTTTTITTTTTTTTANTTTTTAAAAAAATTAAAAAAAETTANESSIKLSKNVAVIVNCSA